MGGGGGVTWGRGCHVRVRGVTCVCGVSRGCDRVTVGNFRFVPHGMCSERLAVLDCEWMWCLSQQTGDFSCYYRI